MSSQPNVAIYVDPPSHHFRGDRLFEPSTNPYSGDNILAPYIAIKEAFQARGVPVHTSDLLEGNSPGRVKAYFSLGSVADLPNFEMRPDTVVSGYFASECPIVEPSLFRALPALASRFRHLLSWSDGTALEPFVGTKLNFRRYLWPQSFDRVNDELHARRDRKHMVMINSNKLPRLYVQELYTARVRAVAYFHKFGEIDLYGPHWNHAPRRVGKTLVPATVRARLENLWELKQRILPDPDYAACAAAWRGRSDSKCETLSRYNFALCFENQILFGWMTEKLFDCLYAGTIPIYWGAPDIQEWVPKECYIDYREFQDFGKLREFLQGLGEADIQRYREAARDFVASSAFDPFRRSTFVDIFRQLIQEDTGIEA